MSLEDARTPLGELIDLAGQVCDKVRELYGDEALVREAAVIVEIDVGDSTDFLWRFSDDRMWANQGFLREVYALMKRERLAADD